MRKCLFINNSPQPGNSNQARLGGGEKSLLTLSKKLIDNGWKIKIICPAQGSFTNFAHDMGIEYAIYPYQQPALKHPLRTFRNHLKWEKILEEFKPDIIHANSAGSARTIVYTANSQKIPLICHLRFYSSENDMHWMFRHMPTPNAFIFNSYALKQSMWPVLSKKCPTSDSYVIHNAIDKAFRPTPYPEGKNIKIGMIANFIPIKKHEDFIKMAAVLVNDLKLDATFHLAGTDSKDLRIPTLSSLASSLGILNRVQFHGHVSDIPKFISEMHLIVHTSHVEPFGRVIIEAQASARPVIAYKVGGIPEIITHGKNGFLFEKGDYKNIAEKAYEIITTPSLRGDIISNGLKSIKEKFTDDIQIKNIINIYQQILN